MTSMNVRIKKKLGAGLYGSVYLAEAYGQQCIYKLEKTNDNSMFHRQVDFDEFAKPYGRTFMRLIGYGTINPCKYRHSVPYKLSKEDSNWLKGKNKESTCTYLLYTPVLERSLEYTILNRKQHLDMLYQVFNAVNILYTNGWQHRDIHQGNVMYIKDKWLLVDYGAMKHISHNSTPQDDSIEKDYINDGFQVFWNVCMPDVRKSSVQTIKKSNLWSVIKSKVPKNVRDKDPYIVGLACIHNPKIVHEHPFLDLYEFILLHLEDANYKRILEKIKSTKSI
jgi:serine/threonine protein kinase